MYIAISLAKAGYYSGDPELVLRAPANMVMDIILFEGMQNKVDALIMEVSKEQNS